MTKHWSVWVLALFLFAGNGTAAPRTRTSDSLEQFDLTQSSPHAQVVSPDVFRQIGSQDAALRAMDARLGAIDERLKGIQNTLDHEVLPTIHVFDFLKWLFALIAAAITGVAVNNLFKRRQASAA